MTLIQFKKIEDVLSKLLTKQNILIKETKIVRIDLFPDYNQIPYERSSVENLIFENSWSFSELYRDIFKISFDKQFIFDHDSIQKLSHLVYGRAFSEDQSEKVLTEAYGKKRNDFNDYKIAPSFDDFELYSLIIKQVDNNNRKVLYKGTYMGHTSDIDNGWWNLYTTASIIGVPIQEINEFYKELFIESYILFNDNKMNLAYFIAYSAFESYINSKFEDSQSGRLKDKIKDLFAETVPNLTGHQVYSSIIGQFDSYTSKRNIIAHGREKITITKEEYYNLLLFCSLLVNSYETGSNTFADLAENITCHIKL